MAEEMSDKDFKANVMRFIEVANQKFDGLTSDIRTNSVMLERIDNNLNIVTSDVSMLTKQFNDVAVMAIKDHKRIDNLEERVDVLEAEVH